MSGKIVVHRGRAHADDFLASCVCIYKTGLPLFRMDASREMLDDPYCWVLDQGLDLNPQLLNFDHHHIKDNVCSLTLLLDHFYGKGYRTHFPQLSYIEIHDSAGASKAAKFAGVPYEAIEISSSVIQHLVLKCFSRMEGLVEEPIYSLMSLIGMELCEKIEGISADLEDLDKNATMVEFLGMKILDVTNCSAIPADRLPTKTWCQQKNLSPSAILTRDSRVDAYRLVRLDSSLFFSKQPECEYTHPSGFLAIFKNLQDWKVIMERSIVSR